MNTRWWEIRERGSLLGIRCVLWTARLLGYRASALLVRVVVTYFYLTSGSSRRASATYLTRLREFSGGKTPEPTFGNGLRHHLAFGLTTLDRIFFWQGRTEAFQIKRIGHELVTALAGTGGLMVGAHLGSFDVLRTESRSYPIKVTAVMFRSHARNINRILQGLAKDGDIDILELTPGDLSGVMKLQDIVSHGGTVAMLGDRRSVGSTERVTKVSFLGRPASFPSNPWIVASVLQCPVYLTFGLRVGDRCYELHAEKFADRIVLPRRKREAALEEYIRRYVARLEDLCCSNPYQWFNYFDFWKSDAK